MGFEKGNGNTFNCLCLKKKKTHLTVLLKDCLKVKTCYQENRETIFRRRKQANQLTLTISLQCTEQARSHIESTNSGGEGKEYHS